MITLFLYFVVIPTLVACCVASNCKLAPFYDVLDCLIGYCLGGC